uniref:DDHD domain-containing protein n=1 Tax=Panagrellus redivivus TaxID=6233 RepID=A0A7E4ZUV3_PANRE
MQTVRGRTPVANCNHKRCLASSSNCLSSRLKYAKNDHHHRHRLCLCSSSEAKRCLASAVVTHFACVCVVDDLDVFCLFAFNFVAPFPWTPHSRKTREIEPIPSFVDLPECPPAPETSEMTASDESNPSTARSPATPATTTESGTSVASSTASTATAIAPPPINALGTKKKRRVMDLRCTEIRWFIKKEADSKWTPLLGYDSLIIEVAYRRRNNMIIDDATLAFIDEIPKTDSIIVLDGLYSLDADAKNLDSVYWKDESLPLRRGSWFQADSMQPLEMDIADAIEKHHLTSFRDQSIPEGPVFSDTESSKRPVLTTLPWGDHDEIRWNSVIDIVWYNNSKTNRIIRFVTRSKGTVLKRGYTEAADIADGRPNFSDLILVVHGIGQKGYENLIAKNTGQMREVIHSIMDKYYTHEKRRPMILPIEWRAGLILDEGVTETITLPRMPNMRNVLNSVAMDIMYYQSPLYRSEIINGVIRSMNHTYSIFKRNNPNFTGNVSIVAHSLGSVITYDILTNWSPLLLYDEFVTNAIQEHMQQTNIDEKERALLESFYTSRTKMFEEEGPMRDILLHRDEPLQFKVENLFAIGSPLGVFLVMRGFDYTRVNPGNHNVSRIFNIFHPYDPVAYRLEPLYHTNYKNIRPVKVAYYADERARKSYANLPYDLHKSYMRKVKKIQKKQDKDKGKGDINIKDEEEDEDSDDDDLSTGSSPRSASPIQSDSHQGGVRDPPELPNPPASGNRSSWWKFSSNNATTATTPSTHSEDIEVAKEASSGGSGCSSKDAHSPVPPARPPPPGASKAPLTLVEALVEEIPPERRLQNNVQGETQRLDYFLQPALTDKSYWSVLKSHFAYWQSYDLIAFMLNALYPAEECTDVVAAK